MAVWGKGRKEWEDTIGNRWFQVRVGRALDKPQGKLAIRFLGVLIIRLSHSPTDTMLMFHIKTTYLCYLSSPLQWGEECPSVIFPQIIWCHQESKKKPSLGRTCTQSGPQPTDKETWSEEEQMINCYFFPSREHFEPRRNNSAQTRLWNAEDKCVFPTSGDSEKFCLPSKLAWKYPPTLNIRFPASFPEIHFRNK